MRWEVEFTPPALRFLRKVDRPLRDAIAAGIQRLAEELAGGIDRPTGSSKLVGMNASRLRLGDYRVVFRTEKREVRTEPNGPTEGENRHRPVDPRRAQARGERR